MAARETSDPHDLKALVLRVLDENQTMTLATLRADGWPQATIVGYVHDDLTLYCAVAQASQKLDNIRRDPRSSVAIGHKLAGDAVRGISMAALADEVTDMSEIVRLNALIQKRYPEIDVFAPRQASAAVIRLRPSVVSLVDEEHGFGEPVLLNVTSQTSGAPAAT